ncbi:MAG: hypothetical protein H6834_08170 [Planctomycetes bacterium]|nr:hypothetical protein [Planctomycetota bacterium]
MASVAGIFFRAGLVVVGIQVAFWAWDHGRQTVEDLSRNKDRLILPGPLLTAHAREIGDDCHQCHGDGMQRVDRARCLRCHEDIAARLEVRRGYHGTLRGNCEDCHVEHQGADANLITLDATTFNHALTEFALTGAHVDVACDRCHVQELGPSTTFAESRRFVNVPHASCADCHRDPHEGQLEARCDQCHHADGFHPPHVHFDHAKEARFSPGALHAKLDCGSCHTSLRYRDAEETCEACHAPVQAILSGGGLAPGEPDPHFGQITCAKCHDPAEPLGAPQRHAERCSSCHNEHYGNMLFARMGLITKDIAELSERGSLTPEEKAWAESAVFHNYASARRFLETKR